MPEYFTEPFRRYRTNRKIKEILKTKIALDLGNSFLGSQSDAENAMSLIQRRLREASSQAPHVGTLQQRLPETFRWTLRAGRAGDNDYFHHVKQITDYRARHSSIRIGCPATCVAAIAILRDLQERFASRGLRIDLACTEINGNSFFTALLAECRLDLAIGAIEAMVLVDERVKLPLRLIAPMFGVRQEVYVNTRKRVTLTPGIWVFDRSSAKLQYFVGQAIPRNAEEKTFDDARIMSDLVDGIPAGDMIVTWDAVTSLLRKRPEYAAVPQSDFVLHFCLFGHSKIFRPNRFPLESVLAVLLAEWRERKRPSSAFVNRLSNDHTFMESFALSAGHRWIAEL